MKCFLPKSDRLGRERYVCSYKTGWDSNCKKRIIVKMARGRRKVYPYSDEKIAELNAKMYSQINCNPNYQKEVEERIIIHESSGFAGGFFWGFAFATVKPEFWPVPAFMAMWPIISLLMLARIECEVKEHKKLMKFLERENLLQKNDFLLDKDVLLGGLSNKSKELLSGRRSSKLAVWMIESLSRKDFDRLISNMEHEVAASYDYQLKQEEAQGVQLTIGKK